MSNMSYEIVEGYCVRNLFTRGIERVKVEFLPPGSSEKWIADVRYQVPLYRIDRDFFFKYEDACRAAQNMIDKKIRTLQREIDRLREIRLSKPEIS